MKEHSKYGNIFQQSKGYVLAFISFQVLLILIVFYLLINESTIFKPIAQENIIKIAVMAINLIAVVISKRMFNSAAEKSKSISLAEKVNTYNETVNKRAIILTLTNLLNILAFHSTENYIFFAIFLIIIVLQVVYFPNKKDFVRSFRVSEEVKNYI